MRNFIDLVEMLNTPAKGIKWSVEGHINKGTYELDGDLIEIRLEEYDTKFGSFVDFGFSVNGSIQAVNGLKYKGSLIGSVLNGASPKLSELNPDVIMVCINKKTGMIDSRKSAYSTIISWYIKRSAYSYRHDWIENKVGFYTLIAKHKLSSKEEQTFISTVRTK